MCLESGSVTHTSPDVVIQDSSSALHGSSEHKTFEGTSEEQVEKEDNQRSGIKRVLTEDDRAKLIKLENSFIVAIVNSQGSIPEEINVREIHGLVNMSVINVQKFVKFFKLFDEFQDMTVEVQTACLKAHMCSCLILLSAFYLYDASCACFFRTRGVYS